jgi:hypothetical protein
LPLSGSTKLTFFIFDKFSFDSLSCLELGVSNSPFERGGTEGDGVCLSFSDSTKTTFFTSEFTPSSVGFFFTPTTPSF